MRVSPAAPQTALHKPRSSPGSAATARAALVKRAATSMAQPAAPAGWEYHWSHTFEQYYLWSPATNAVRWPDAAAAGAAGAGATPQPGSSLDGSAAEGQGGSADDALAAPLAGEYAGDAAGGDDATDEGAADGYGTEMPGAEEAEEAGGHGQHHDDEGVNECCVDFGDARVGFPERKPVVAAHMHGWTYPPLIELLDRLLCSGARAGAAGNQAAAEGGSHVNVIVELGSWLGCSTRLLAQLAPQATIYSVDKWDNDYLSEKEGEEAMFGGMGARQGLDDAIQHTKQLLDLPLYDTFVRAVPPFTPNQTRSYSHR